MPSPTTLNVLLHTLRSLGASVSVRDGRLRVDAPKDALTPDLQDAIRNHKLELIRVFGDGQGGPESQPIPTVDDDFPTPLTHAQQRLWLFQEIDPSATAFNLTPVVRLDGPLDPPRLEEALNRLVQRHEPLRTVYSHEGGDVRQRVLDDVQVTIAIEEHFGDSARPDMDRLREAIRAEQNRSFDLATDLPLRLRLLRWAPDVAHLLGAFHHVAVDGTSIHLFFNDLVRLYGGEQLEDLPVRYRDYAAWERKSWDQSGKRDVEFWADELSGASLVLDIATDRPRPGSTSFDGGIVGGTLERKEAGRLSELVRDERASLFMVLFAAFAAALHRHTGQRTLVIGAPVSGRSRVEVERLVGMFVNQIPLRVDIPAGSSFRGLLRNVRTRVLDGFAHQDIPFGLIIERLAPPRDGSRAPIFQAMLNVLPPSETEIARSGGLVCSSPDASEMATLFDRQSNLDLALYGRQFAGSVNLELLYNRNLFHEERARSIFGEIESVLLGGLAAPDLPLDEALLERFRTARGGGAGGDSESPDESVADRFAQVVDRYRDRPAVVWEDGMITYGELQDRAGRITALIRDAALPQGTPVAVFVPHEPVLAEAILGVLGSGHPYVPLDPEYPEERLAFMVEDSSVGLVITTASLAARAAILIGNEGGVSRVEEAASFVPNRGSPVDPGSIAYLLYTSGSTGRPKAVVQSARNLVRQADRYARSLLLKRSDRLALTASISFDASLMDLFGALLTGAALSPVDLRSVDLARLPMVAMDRDLTVLHVTPTVFRTLASVSPEARFPTVRTVVLGGEPVRAEDVAYFDRSFDPKARLLNLYGSAEHSFALGGPVDRTLHERTGEVPIGLPIDDVDAVLIGDEGRPDPVKGTLAIRSRYSALGYNGRPEHTAETFVEDPERPGERVYRTGDVMRRRPDGAYVFLHRVDDQFKIRGHRVEPGEVEAVLKQHSSVAEAAAHGPEGPDGLRTLVVCVVPVDAGNPPTPAELAAWCRERLPRYMVPTSWTMMSALPRTPTGKIDRKALPDPASNAGPTVTYVAPRTTEEEVLAEIWAEVLGIPSVGIHDDFFDLGGHSLTAVEVVARARDVSGLELSLREFFDHPTIAALAGRPRDEPAALALPPVARQAGDAEVPLSFAQERLWVFQELDPDLSTYNMAPVIELGGPVAVERLLDAIRLTVERHEPLRTLLVERAGKVTQRVVSVPDEPVEFMDLSALEDAEAERGAADAIRKVAGRPFRPADEIPFRGLLIRRSAQRHDLLLVFHHLALDANSASAFWRDMLAFYEGRSLAELPVRYRDFAMWERRVWDGERLAEGVAFWRRHLEGAPIVLDLATDRPRPADQTFKGGRISTELAGPAFEALSALLREEKASAFMGLLAAFGGALALHTRQSDVVIGAPSTGRSRTELLDMVGMFANQLALRVPVDGGASFRELLRTARGTALAAFSHQGVPFPLLLQELNPPRDRSRTPLFQAMLTMIPPAPEDASVEIAGTRFIPPSVGEVTAMGDPQARFDLTLVGQQRGDRLDLGLVYNSDLYDAARMEGLLEHIRHLLVEDPDRPIVDIGRVTPRDRARLVERWNDTALEYDRTTNVPQQIAACAEAAPDRVAVDSPTGSFTYAELVREAQRINAALEKLGVKPGDRVGILMERSREMLAVLLGILGVGAAYVPLDPAFPKARLEYMLRHSGARVLVTHNGLEQRLDTEVSVLDLDRWTAPGPVGFRATGPDEAAYVIYTSGSTGEPKGVEISHGAMVNFLTSMSREPGVCEDDRLLAVTTISFDIAVLELYLPLITGARVVIAGEEETGDGRRLADRLEADGITVMQATPATWKVLIASGWAGKKDLNVLCGGEALPPSLAEALLERTGELWNMYGPTETTVWSTVQRVSPGEPIVIGRPIANTTVYVLDEERHLLPVGVPGELWIGGDGVANGYVDRPDLTAERFIESPFREGERIYRTGDLVRWRADGRLEHLGRLDHQVKVRGFRIELGEVESRLRSHPEVEDVVVVARDERLVAYIVARADAPVVAELRTWVAQTLPQYMVPSFFVPMEAFPLTPNGKVDRKGLPDPEGYARPTVTHVAPRTSEEEVLVEIWAEVLGIPSVGIHDDFFELGGHSLTAVEVVAHARDVLGVDVPLRRLFDHPTVAESAEWIVNERGSSAERIPIGALEEGEI